MGMFTPVLSLAHVSSGGDLEGPPPLLFLHHPIRPAPLALVALAQQA